MPTNGGAPWGVSMSKSFGYPSPESPALQAERTVRILPMAISEGDIFSCGFFFTGSFITYVKSFHTTQRSSMLT